MVILLKYILLFMFISPEKNIWSLPEFEPEEGEYTEDWDILSRYYNVPQWWRDAKFGAWSHWDPQSAAEYGDWYSRGMYMQGTHQYNYHLDHYGHPSQYGYKDLCNDWNIDLWNPDELMQLYLDMGARYFVAMGNHHDNFDCWDSEYQPWNSVNVGPKKDIVGIWKEAADRYGMPFGIGFHATPARTYGQFMTVRYKSDSTGPYAGIPYDAMLTKEDGKGKWWDGLDPVDLYGPVHKDGRNSLETAFATQFMWRVDDAIRKYQPDMIYFDDHAGDSQIDLGINMGLGKLTPQILADFYNIALKRTKGYREVVATFKGVGGRYNSFQNDPDLLPIVDRSLVKSTEFYTEDNIMAYPFQTEVSLQEWHFMKDAPYRSASEIVLRLMQNVSRNGSLLLNITQKGRGNIESEAKTICEDIGSWLKVNGEAVYGTRPFDVWGDEHCIYSRKDGDIYVTMIDWDGDETVLQPLSALAPSVGKISKISLLGDTECKIEYVQDIDGLTLKAARQFEPINSIRDTILSQGFKVLKIEHDKKWFNDDDPGVMTIGWNRACNLGKGDFNNDLYFTNNPGDEWITSFNGSSVIIVSPVGVDGGKMRIIIDGNDHGLVDLYSEVEKHQEKVFNHKFGTKGKHTIQIICADGNAAIDALIID